FDYNIGAENDSESFSQAMSYRESLWYNAMKEEINSMKSNDVCDLVSLPKGVKAIRFRMLGRYQSNPSIDHWRAAKNFLRYLKGTKDYMLTYKRSDNLDSFIFGLKLVDSISKSLMIYCDNSVGAFMAKNNKSESRSKHINIKYLVVREHVKEKKMLVDPLAKGMPPYKFKDHVVTM
ncbi:hypothetical protein E1A91_D11G244500v1, partial [Gossypium mustelinum]